MMHRRQRYTWQFVTAVVATLILTTAAHAAGQGKAAKKPNVLFILADDMRPDAIAALGNKHVQTPNLDKLVRRGFVFRHAYCMGSFVPAVCLPSRTMILTGKNLFHIDPGRGAATKEDHSTFPLVMRAAGYVTIRSGKFSNNPSGICKAFDKHLDGKTAERDADNLIAFIREHAGKQPMFLHMASSEPHDPQFAPPKYYPLYKAENLPLPPNFRPYHPFDNGEMTIRDELTLPWPRTRENVTGKLARYYASITYLDEQIGRVLKALQDAGEMENTIVIFSSDNGLSLGEHGLLGKQNLYENGGMSVPLIFAGPGIPKGQSDAFAYLFDIFPTVCELSGTAIPKSVDGKSLASLMHGKTAKVRDHVFLGYRDVQRSIRDDRWHLIRYPHINKSQLFDLKNDPHEMKDLAAAPEHAAKLKEMTALLEKVQRELGDQLALTSANPRDPAWTPEKAKVKKGMK